MKPKKTRHTQEEIRARFCYDPHTGIVTFRIAPPNQPKSLAGTEAGYIRDCKYGKYRVIKLGGDAIYAHRLIWMYMFGEWPKHLIDHKNGNKLDNRLDNLRPASSSGNKANGQRYANNTSGFKGVVKYGDRWKAQITHRKKVIYLGIHETKLEAHAAYVQAARQLHGEFCRTD